MHTEWETLHGRTATIPRNPHKGPGGDEEWRWPAWGPWTPRGLQAAKPVGKAPPCLCPWPLPPSPQLPRGPLWHCHPLCFARHSHLVPGSPPPVLTCLVFFFPKFLMYMSYSFTGGRSKRENVNEKSKSMSRSSFALRVL